MSVPYASTALRVGGPGEYLTRERACGTRAGERVRNAWLELNAFN